MKNNRLPSKKEWDKIIDDAFSSEETHQFSEGYIQRRTRLQKGILMDSNERKRIKETPQKKVHIGAVAGIAAALALIPASILTINHISGNKVPTAETSESQTEETTSETATEETTEAVTEEQTVAPDFYARIESTAEYQNYIYVNYPADGDRINETLTTEFGWLPDGVQRDSFDPVYGKFHNGYGGGMTPCLYTVPETGIQERLDNSADFEQYETDDRVIMINYRAGYQENAPHDDNYEQDKSAHINFGREVWVAFKGTKYVQMFFITDDFSKDDARQIAENIILVPTGGETGCEWTNSYEESETAYDDIADYYFNATVPIDKANFVTVGDAFDMQSDNGINVEIKVNSARYQDNFDGLYTDGCGWETDFSDFISTDGRIHNRREWTKLGDGINSIDTVVRTDDQIMKVLILDVTYKNKSNSDITWENSVASCICPTLLTEYNEAIAQPSFIDYNGMYPADSLKELMCDDMHFSFDSPNKSSKNNVDIPAGETADIRLAFLVSEDMVGNVYIDITGRDWRKAEYPFVDLCDIK